GAEGGVAEDLHAVDVDGPELPSVLRERNLRDVVMDHAYARDGPGHGLGVADVAAHELDGGRAIVVVDEGEHPDVVAALTELPDAGCPEVPGAAGNEDAHLPVTSTVSGSAS